MILFEFDPKSLELEQFEEFGLMGKNERSIDAIIFYHQKRELIEKLSGERV